MTIAYKADRQHMEITLSGDYLSFSDEEIRQKLFADLKNKRPATIVLNGQELGQWDSTLAVVLFEVIKFAQKHSLHIDLSGLPENLRHFLDLAFAVDRKPEATKLSRLPFLEAIGSKTLDIYHSSRKGSAFIKQVLISILKGLSGKAVMRRIDFYFAMEDASYKAIAIVSLVSFMVGLILAFVGAIQLKTFGAQIYVSSLVAIAMTRIMGAIMVGIIMAGRTGASYAATIGSMQVNEEIDALKTMGISATDFLVLPRITSLLLTIPFLTILADAMGIIGGGAVGVFMLGISPHEYWTYTWNALSLDNFLVGIFHGFVYGFVIAVCGCYYGIYCGRNADSVGLATTKAVVSAIVWMIVLTGIITFLLEVVGL
ncbi:MAG: ABC transporter permease [Alphaproteobacteria bacterium]|nr:ABC transporter permease [Alphaproteobacteria bacterium]